MKKLSVFVVLFTCAIVASAALAAQSANDTGIPVNSTPPVFKAAPLPGTASFTGTEPTMSPRFFRSGTPGDACSTFSSGNFQYQKVEFISDPFGSLTVAFDPGTCGNGIFVTFHQNSFNPASICDNYVWSFGSSQAFTETFTVPANAPMVMVVSGVANAPGVVCGPYTYQITGVATEQAVPGPGKTSLLIMVSLFAAIGVSFLVRKGPLA